MMNPVGPMISVNKQFKMIIAERPVLGINKKRRDNKADKKKHAIQTFFFPNLATIGLISIVPRIVNNVPKDAKSV